MSNKIEDFIPFMVDTGDFVINFPSDVLGRPNPFVSIAISETSEISLLQVFKYMQYRYHLALEKIRNETAT